MNNFVNLSRALCNRISLYEEFNRSPFFFFLKNQSFYLQFKKRKEEKKLTTIEASSVWLAVLFSIGPFKKTKWPKNRCSAQQKCCFKCQTRGETITNRLKYYEKNQPKKA